jgi:glycosyltransferase involved in cell wall biosynthesis
MNQPSIRIYFPTYPFPPREGAAQVVADQLKSLAELGFDVELVVWKESPGSLRKKRQEAEKTLFRGALERITVTALPGEAGPETGIRRLLRTAQALSEGNASPERYYYPRRDRSPLARRQLGVYHYSFAYPWFKKGPASEDRRVVHFHNLESDLFAERAAASRSPVVRRLHELNSQRLRSHEAALSRLADELWFLSPVDEARYRSSAGTHNARLVPPTLPRELAQARAKRHPTTPPRLGFIGALDFGPNRDSVTWILERLAPELRKSGFDGQIVIAGKGADAKLQHEARAWPFVTWAGYLESTEEFWSSLSVFLAPHVSGSGVRLKILEALVSGVPTLTTHAGAERLHPALRNHPLLGVSDDPVEWSRLIQKPPVMDETVASRCLSALDGKNVYSFVEGLLQK